MKKIFSIEYCSAKEKAADTAKVFILRGTAFTMDAHSLLHNLSTPFFPRR
jgi:hypothetical protein